MRCAVVHAMLQPLRCARWPLHVVTAAALGCASASASTASASASAFALCSRGVASACIRGGTGPHAPTRCHMAGSAAVARVAAPRSLTRAMATRKRPASLLVAASSRGCKQESALTAIGTVRPLVRASERSRTGEDAFFLHENDRYASFGVADGLGQWKNFGVDPSAFPWELMSQCVAEADSASDSGDLLKRAYTGLVRDGNVEAGSSCACVARMKKENGAATFASIGDCTFIVMRRGIEVPEMIHHSSEQLHSFNHPYQLAVRGRHVSDLLVSVEGVTDQEPIASDMPEDAETTSIQLQSGDLIVMGTDGMFDNLTSGEVMNEVSRYYNDYGVVNAKATPALWDRQCVLSSLAERLVNLAHAHSTDKKYHSPFAMRWNRRIAVLHEPGERWSGGKEDDITVVVAEAYSM